MALTQTDKAEQFRVLHEAQDAFVIANVWDGGSARMMAGLGFAALATSSALANPALSFWRVKSAVRCSDFRLFSAIAICSWKERSWM